MEILSLSSPEVVAKEEDLDAAPRGGAVGRSPDSISARSLAASFLIMRKRPSIASYVAPGIGDEWVGLVRWKGEGGRGNQGGEG